jgi:carboxylesterase
VQRLAERLAASGVSTRTVLLPGHGLPGRRMPFSRWTEWFAAVSQAQEELASRHRRVDLVGFSTGAPLVLHLCAHRPVNGRLVLLAPFLRVYRPRFSPVRAEVLLRAFPFLTAVPRRRPPLRDGPLRQKVEHCAGYRTFSLSSAKSALELIELVEAELPSIVAPTLIIQGRQDTVVDPRGAALVEARLGGPRRLFEVDSDHLLTLDTSASLVLDVAQRFLIEPGDICTP